ncbi:COG4223 family protein [Rhodobacter sp. SY28-1]|uniref:COG4223 family protein n=1 Tax=Rhodobacter sp. SY28-1 TaxID=2562317 RepID=UPI0010BF8F34|nr:mitofilin family membrane protein [Rhodobacter sp. SY28-1]
MTRRKEPQSDTAADPAPPELTEPVSTAPPFVEEVPLDSVKADAPPPEPPSAPAPPAPVPPPAPRRGGVFAPLLGGALAAIGGFTLSHFDILGLAAPSTPVDLAPLTAKVDDLATRQAQTVDKLTSDLTSATARIDALEARPLAEPPDMSRLDDLDQRLDAIEAMPSDGTANTAALAAKLAELDRRLTALPATDPSEDLQEQLDAALARLDAAEATATSRAAEAEAATAAASRAQALDALKYAVTEGRPFAPELQTLADPVLSAALEPLAASGVPTLETLQSTFPDAAREALRLAREISGDDGWTDRLVDFLASQTGARPVTPIEGTTPDAILSRAEFALSEGRVADAVAELDPLDPAAKAPLDPWIAQAKTHLAAAAALAAARGE